jgi:hypothetical protein
LVSAVAAAASLLGCRTSPEANSTRPIDRVTIATHPDLHSRRTGVSHTLLDIRSDGAVEWNDDNILGLGRKHRATIDSGEASRLIDQIANYVRTVDTTAASISSPFEFTTIDVSCGGKDLRLSSPHEIWESRGGLASQSELYAGGAEPGVVRSKWSTDYLVFRGAWDAIRERTNQLIRECQVDPPSGRVTAEDTHAR